MKPRLTAVPYSGLIREMKTTHVTVWALIALQKTQWKESCQNKNAFHGWLITIVGYQLSNRRCTWFYLEFCLLMNYISRKLKYVNFIASTSLRRAGSFEKKTTREEFLCFTITWNSTVFVDVSSK